MKIIARHPTSLKMVELDYSSITQAKKKNPDLINWRVKDVRS